MKTKNIFTSESVFKTLLATLIGATTLSGCEDSSYLDVDASDRPALSAFISFVNARPVNENLNFWTFTDKISPAPIPVNVASAYYPTVFGSVQINFTEANNTGYKASYQFGNSPTFSATGRPNGPIATFYHTVVAARTSSNKADSLILFYDDLKAPDAGKAKLRFVNLSPGAGTLNVLNGSTALFSNVAYGRAANSSLSGEALSAWSLGPFQSVNPGQYDLNFTNSITGNAVGTAKSVTLESGKIYTVFTNGLIGGAPSFSVSTIEHPVK
ncbi:DUF4397 domain-containing protein [Dyadobacter sp. CY312]|uniref:DUF4397 domain-containing protein n=1 Tax=Dyadobacter sp. CY312 TaxID=2907303 RepID=UPI001F1E329E|nr:DUF4397 domain-containing protein [Dyadobacter sp. CY312]MCE7042440.1 DUF4397 domain-containing protein [Dyadobacter sp. CY312]